MKTLIVILIILSPIIGEAQNINFIKSYGNNGYDYGRDIKQDVDTGYIATGSSSSFTSGNADAFLLKVDSLGNFKWSYDYGGSGADWGESVVVTLDSSYAIGGYTNSYGAGGFDFYLVRTNNVGVPLWEKTYGGSDWERAHDMVQLADSGFVLVGETYSFGNGNMDVYMVRTDKNGDTLWTKTYGGTEDDYANAILLDGDSLIVVGGTTSFGAGMTDGLILKYHIDGTFGWSKVAGQVNDDYFTSITMNSVNNEYVLGGTRDYNHWQNCDCGQDFWFYYINKQGNIVQDTSFEGEQLGSDIIFDLVHIINSNQVIYGGSTTSWGNNLSEGTTNAFLGRLSPTYLFAPYVGPFGVEDNDVVYALDTCTDKGVIAIGNLGYNSSGGMNIFIAKMNELNSGGGIQVTQELTNENITLSLQDISKSNSFNVYPTLFQNNIQIDGLPNENMIEIFDLQGKILYTKNNVQNNIDLSELSNGMMIMVISTPEGKYSAKIIKD